MTDTFTPVEIQHRAFWHALLSQIIDPTNRPNPGKVPTALMDTTSYLWSTPHCPRRVIGTFDPHFTVRASSSLRWAPQTRPLSSTRCVRTK